uniref:Small ribosomal subunit protein uS9c n=1 Tax=Volvocales sp. NrCl902 TaxID=2682054 RepID=A0A7G1GGA3_9CHLO|nr:ribosomal protein S9 [Volvocales sp. NrCl902]
MSQNSRIIITSSVGKRKEAIAHVKLISGSGKFIINNYKAEDYFQKSINALSIIKCPFVEVDALGLDPNRVWLSSSIDTFDTIVKVKGGGLIGQAEAIKLGVVRAFCKTIASQKILKVFKDKGYLTRDSRVKERRKYGLKKARKAPQFSKR